MYSASIVEMVKCVDTHLSILNIWSTYVCDERYKVIDGIIYFDGKIYLVPDLELKELITKGLESGFHLLEDQKILGWEDYNVSIIK